MDRMQCQNSMGHIAQQLDVEPPLIFFKYGWLLEKKLTKTQNLTLYISYGKIPHFMANISLTQACYTSLASIGLEVKKWD